MAEFNLSSTSLNEKQNHDDFIVIWFCENDLSDELKNFGDYLKRFNTFENCIHFIKSYESECKFLIVIDDVQLVSRLNNYYQIQGIYVLGKPNQNTEDEKKMYPKLVDIFINRHELILALRRDILLTYRNNLSITISCLKEITIEQSIMSLHGNAMIFYWNQLFIHYLVSSTSIDMSQLKQDMIKQCQLEYQNNLVQIKEINNFDQSFNPNDVLRWYTKDSFVYRLVNKAFRTRNIDLICKFQYFIFILFKKLKDLSLEQQYEDNLIVYRGQIMKLNNLEELKLNVGNLISINTFMSTTRNENVAHHFIAGSPIGVIFEINTGLHNNNTLKTFADISHLSLTPDEEEILFSVGTVFRIDSFEQESHSIWIIKLTLNNDMDEQINRLNDLFQRQLINSSETHHLFMKIQDIDMIKRYYQMLTNQSFPFNEIPTITIDINIAYILSNLGNYDKAIQFYQNILLNNDVIDVHKSIVLNIIIGYNYFNLSRYDDALCYYGIAYSLLDEDILLTGELYNHIGDIWLKKNDLEYALPCYQQALIILDDNISYHHKADIYRKMSYVHRKLNHFDEANVYEEQANEINQLYGSTPILDDQTLISLQHELERDDLTAEKRARHLYSIGLCYIRKQNYSQALQYLLQAEQLYITHRPTDNRHFSTYATLYDNLALVYLFLNDHLKALIMWKKGLDIRANIPFI